MSLTAYRVTLLATNLDCCVFLSCIKICSTSAESTYRHTVLDIVRSVCIQGDVASWPNARNSYACLYTTMFWVAAARTESDRSIGDFKNDNHSHVALPSAIFMLSCDDSPVYVRNSCLVHGLSLDSWIIYFPPPSSFPGLVSHLIPLALCIPPTHHPHTNTYTHTPSVHPYTQYTHTLSPSLLLTSIP